MIFVRVSGIIVNCIGSPIDLSRKMNPRNRIHCEMQEVGERNGNDCTVNADHLLPYVCVGDRGVFGMKLKNLALVTPNDRRL